jgi:iron complex transport system substrate-binding protein
MLALRPDLVILRGASAPIEQLCMTNGIDLFCDRTEKFDDIYRNITELGQLLDQRERGEKLSRRMRERLKSIADAVAGRRPPRVLMTLARSPDAIASVMTASRGTFVDEMIRMAGGENVFAGLDMDYPTISTEAILVSRPEVIVDAMPELEMTPSLEAQIVEQWKAVGSTPAARDGRIHVLDEDHCYIPSPRIVEIIEKLARLFHPEVSLD